MMESGSSIDIVKSFSIFGLHTQNEEVYLESQKWVEETP